MSPEISSLIREIQLTLRREAGIPSYDPADPSLPPLPTVPAAVAALDPAQLHRCSRCRGPLIRGADSTVCVFCGADRRREAPAKVLKFWDTAGCRNFLDVIGLEGSEEVTLDTESCDSSEALDAPNEAVVLSGLLDIELRWPLEKGEIDNISINNVPSRLPLETEENNNSTRKLISQSSYASNVSGVDLDSFFSDSKKETTSAAPGFSSEQLIQKKNRDNQEAPDSQNFGFLENFQSSGVTKSTVNTKDGDFGESFADWDADFQSASTETFTAVSKSADLFLGSSVAEFSAPASSTFSQKTDIEQNPRISGNNGEHRDVEGVHSSTNDWIADDIWSQMGREAVNTTDQFKGGTEAHSARSEDLHNITSVSDSWIQDDIWLSSGKQELNSAKNIEENDDFVDVWQDFTGSGDAQGGMSNSLAEGVMETSSTKELNNETTVDDNDDSKKNIEENDDFLDVWQDFTGSGDAQGGMSNSLAVGVMETSNTKELNNETTVDDNDDSFDAWQDFTSSGQVSGALSIPWLENGTEVTTTQHASGVKSLVIEDMNFGSFLHSDSLTGVLGDQKGNQEAESVQFHSSASERINEDEKIDADSTIKEVSNTSAYLGAAQNPDSPSSDVQKLLSQMHDLSFMLENTLSVPNKGQGSGLNP